jgi:glycerol dehydrogenase-like iron-containing ADH family enzyme
MPIWPGLTRGKSVLKSTSRSWPKFDVITTRSPWLLTQGLLGKAPEQVQFVESLQRDVIRTVAQRITENSIVVGIGSGLAMEAAKLTSKLRNARLIQVPTTASNNAYFTTSAWTFENGKRFAERNTPIPIDVIVDEELIGKAPARLNRAGLAEILCSYTALFDWELGYRAGLDVDWDDDLKQFTQSELQALEMKAPRIGADDPEAILDLIDAGWRFAPHFAAHPKARFNGGSEHVFAWALEENSGIRLIHGEIVALGILVMAHLQGQDVLWPAHIIRQAGILYKPEDLGLTWDIVEDTVMQLPVYCRGVPWYSVLNEIDAQVDGMIEYKSRFQAAKNFISCMA